MASFWGDPALPPSLEAQTGLSAQAFAVANYFIQRGNIEFVRAVRGGGSESGDGDDDNTGGGALVFNRWSGVDGRFRRRFVVKHLGSADTYNIAAQREFDMLERLRGAQHIVQLVGPGRAEVNGRLVIVMEFVGHGTLRAMLERFQDRGRGVPERILWCIFLCLTRACIAMSFPPRGAENEPVQRETPPPGREPTTSICHNDMHFENVMIDEIVLGDPEHSVVPLFKVIDFGVATALQEDMGSFGEASSPAYGDEAIAYDGDAWEANILSVGELMSGLAIGEDVLGATTGRSVTLLATGTSGSSAVPPVFTTRAPAELDAAPVSAALRGLVARCLAAAAEERPGREELLEACEAAVYDERRWWGGDSADASYYHHSGRVVYETDRAVRDAVQELLLDADYAEDIRRLREGARRSMVNPLRRCRRRVVVPKRRTM
ncbi:hypothetical protein F4780DRAFT_776150 [Xylariomycetidae sp. FL0641]|nr:hypothetical protein F4780DRAFT_776150 [Xylariomycetidae sp. FL0641]